MYRTVLVIDGMMCTMCEAHVNDIVRKTCPGASVRSDHKKGEVVITSKDKPDTEAVGKAATAMGYKVVSASIEEVEEEREGLFKRLRRRR